MKKFAVLIDADNASYKNIDLVLKEITNKYGEPSVKRAYGDWSTENLKNWNKELLINAITQVQQSAYTVNKNATDMKLVIDAMDLLYKEKLDGFCIISSDSDFTPLASRIRESGLLCYGFGKKKNTAKSFTFACNEFIYVEDLQANQEIESNPKSKIIAKATTKAVTKTTKLTQKETKKSEVKPKLIQKNDTFKLGKKTLTELVKSIPVLENKIEGNQLYVRKLKNIMEDITILNSLYRAIDSYTNNTGWANLNNVEIRIKRQHNFDARNYGKETVLDLVESIQDLETTIQTKDIDVKKKKVTQHTRYVRKIR